MNIWVDADACPNAIKDILYRAANRTETALTLVANQYIRVPASAFIRSIQVEQGFDVADQHIAQQVEPGDIVITADIPLAADVVEKGAHAINPRGSLYTPDNIRQRLAMRNFMEDMRSAGQVSGGPAPMSKTDIQSFANTFDRLLAKAKS